MLFLSFPFLAFVSIGLPKPGKRGPGMPGPGIIKGRIKERIKGRSNGRTIFLLSLFATTLRGLGSWLQMFRLRSDLTSETRNNERNKQGKNQGKNPRKNQWKNQGKDQGKNQGKTQWGEPYSYYRLSQPLCEGWEVGCKFLIAKRPDSRGFGEAEPPNSQGGLGV